MSEERNIDPFSLLILVLSIVAIITEIIGPFAGFYYSVMAIDFRVWIVNIVQVLI